MVDLFYKAEMIVFADILDEALAAWPSSLALQINRVSGNGHIMVLGLVDLSLDMDQPFVSDPRYVLFKNLNLAIATVAHTAAASWSGDVLTIRPDSLPRDSIRKKFEDDLRRTLLEPPHWLTGEEVTAVEKYFADNRAL